MPREKYTNGDAVDIIENERLDYAVRHYCNGSDFKDRVTAELWDEAGTALNALVAYLQDETGRDLSGL